MQHPLRIMNYLIFEQSLLICQNFWQNSAKYVKIGHEGLIYKPKTLVFLVNLYRLFSNRNQKLLLNVYCSDWYCIKAGALQGSILIMILFLIYINKLPGGSKSGIKYFSCQQIYTYIYIFLHCLGSYKIFKWIQ